MSTRLVVTAALLLTAGTLSTSTASAKPSDDAPARTYVLKVSTNPTTTDFSHRRVDVTGTVTKADGTPAPNVPVTIQEVIRFTSWNPWGDPIDPTDYEPRDLGTPVTDAKGKFTIPHVDIDHVTGSSLLDVQRKVEITASFDLDGNGNTPEDGSFARTLVTTKAKATSVTYKVSKKKVKKGDILTIQGKVALPKGMDREGTQVFLQTYWENESRVQTTTEEDGFFVMSVRVRNYDGTFKLRTAPRDLYVAGTVQNLPITNTSLPRR
ncbi:acyl carrier protein [Streptomyces sp. WI04-05B]|uniref:acyl carrier protein n=1 Tax=Streptomyces TaxID=1883 RepID=UPI0029B0AF8F|nr:MULTISPECIES: acyl carrier protein [unclassified Streptomyces]MDX2546422.1 acyl carrier protein [Streptomyces sp. WI04-05B]MDX2586217.1 acyl carrier protein [Streptomyces sp. WI04-05A]MDX3748868.1 acyl carrier protein [Streptomyces sp. AK08-02]